MKLFLTVALLLAVSLSTSAFKANLRINGYSKLPINKEITSQWITQLANDIDIKYHAIHHNGEKLGFRFEVRGKDGKAVNEVSASGHIAIVGTEGKKRGRNTVHTYTKDNNFISPWYDIPELTRSDILNPDNKWWDAKRDVLNIEHRFDYSVKGAAPKIDNHEYEVDVTLDLA